MNEGLINEGQSSSAGEANVAVQQQTKEGGETKEDPTAKLLKARKLSGEINAGSSGGKKEKLEKEMELYEKNDGIITLKELECHEDRLKWWKKYEDLLPILASLAKQFLGIPCSSSKSERVFSTGGRVKTKKRHRLGAERTESLIVLKENRELVEKFYLTTTYKIKKGEKTEAFKSIVQERDKSGVKEVSGSETFKDHEDEDDEDCWLTESESDESDEED
jgi:hypothetical protein